MISNASIRLGEAEPGLLRFVGPAESELAGAVPLRVHSLDKGDVHVNSWLHKRGAFGAVVLDGMLLQSLRGSAQVALRPLGPGDVLALTRPQDVLLDVDSSLRVTTSSRVALLDRDILFAIRRWPAIAAGLHAHAAEQLDRAARQLMICQLPRVGDRLLSVFWLLAEAWGQVTPDGTLLPVPLTHAVLGGLIGARRATVTLAVGVLSEAGAISREPRGWMLHAGPPSLTDTARTAAGDRPLTVS